MDGTDTKGQDPLGFDVEKNATHEPEAAESKTSKKRQGRKNRRRSAGPLSIEPKAVSWPEPEDRKWYLCGLLADCPFSSITFGGVDFSKWQQNQVPRDGDPTSTILSPPEQIAGRCHHLTDVQVEAVLESVAKKVIRSAGTQKTLRSMDGSRYRKFRPMEHDKPAAKYAYMVAIDDPRTADRSYPPQHPPLLRN